MAITAPGTHTTKTTSEPYSANTGLASRISKPKPELRLARHTIGLLAMPHEKTKGNLSLEQQRLIEKLDARAVLVGDSFRFGNRDAGDVRLLKQFGRPYALEGEVVAGHGARLECVSAPRRRLARA